MLHYGSVRQVRFQLVTYSTCTLVINADGVVLKA
jgi:hypothetical protein